MTLESNTRLGHYRIIGLLGRGGMADVYRAEDEYLGRVVALKTVPPKFASVAGRVERFRQEVRAAAGLTHANIITVYEFGEGAGQHFYTMPLMPGGDLKTRIRAHPQGMPPERARTVTAAIARALDYAHRRGFVHRDVKSENILFDEEGTPQLSDFGIARALSSETRMTATGISLGSPQYMSPEQVRGTTMDGRSDLYSLGVVLYEMLTGHLPFEASDKLAVAYSHVNDPVPRLPSAVAEWQGVLDRLVAKSPNDRFATAGELAEILMSGWAPQPWSRRLTRGLRAMSSTAFRGLRRHGVKGRAWVSGALKAGGVGLAMLVTGAMWVQQLETGERSPAGGGAPVRAAPVPPGPPANPEHPLDVRRPEPAVAETEPVAERKADEPADEEEAAAARMEEALGLRRNARRVIQEGLLAAGFDTGGADGLFGARTRAAVSAWQAASGQEATGYVDESTRTTLLANGTEALVERARQRFRIEDYAATAEAARQALGVSPDEAAAHLLLGQALYRQGHHRESIAPLERAIALGERVVLDSKHRHGGWGVRPGFCEGTVSLSTNEIAFHAPDTDHGFRRRPDAIREVRIVERVLGSAVQLNTEIEGRGSFDFLHPAVDRTPNPDGLLFTTGLHCGSCDGSLRVLESLMTTLTQAAR